MTMHFDKVLDLPFCCHDAICQLRDQWPLYSLPWAWQHSGLEHERSLCSTPGIHAHHCQSSVMATSAMTDGFINLIKSAIMVNTAKHWLCSKVSFRSSISLSQLSMVLILISHGLLSWFGTMPSMQASDANLVKHHCIHCTCCYRHGASHCSTLAAVAG